MQLGQEFMKNNKPIQRSELKVGMRVKIPWNGSWWGSNKKYVWLKGTITRVGKESIDISLRKSKGVGKCMIVGNNINYIYRQL